MKSKSTPERTPNKTPATEPSLRSAAWLLLGISSIPGELMLQAGWLSFTAENTGSAWPWQLRKLERRVTRPGIAATIDAGTDTLVFKWSVPDVKVWCPWYYFGGGIKIRKADTLLRFSLGEPANMTLRDRDAAPDEALREAAASLAEVGRMRSRGRLWLDALQTPPATRQGL